MDQKAGREYAQNKGVCLKIQTDGSTCGRQLNRRGQCRLHKRDIYTSTANL
jgi:hypothetical protein